MKKAKHLTLAIALVLSSVTTLAAGPAGIVEKLFIQAGQGAVPRPFDDKMREQVSVEDFGARCDGVKDDTTAIKKAIAAAPVDGVVKLPSGRACRITDTLTLTSRHLVSDGKATIIADLNSATKDALWLDAVAVRGGSAQDYTPAPHLRGILVLVRSKLRDGIRLAYGDYAVWDSVDVQRDPATAPTWRDGVHVESSGDQKWIENLSWRAVRVHDAGRDGFHFEVPDGGINRFINVGSYYDLEVRGSGMSEPGYPVRFVSKNKVHTEKISGHNFIGGEFQTNSTAINPNPHAFAAERAAGAATIENINITGLTAECVPTTGAGLAVDTTNMDRVTISNFLPFGFNGAPSGIGGTGDYVVTGFLGLDKYDGRGVWTVGIKGDATAGTPVIDFQKGVYSRVGKIVTVSFHIKITRWGGAAGQIVITGLPYPVASDPFAIPTGMPDRLNAVALGTGYTMPVLKGRYGTSTVELRKLGSSVNAASINVADAGSGGFEVAGSMTYFTD